MRCGVIKVCGINNNAKRRGGRDVGFLQSRNCAAPIHGCCVAVRLWVQSFFYSIFKLRSGCDIGYYALGCVYTKYRNAHPRFDTSSLQPVPETHLGFTKSQGLYVPASIKTLSTYTRKVPLLLHKKCNNCRNVAKLKYKSFVCTNLWGGFCAG